jgi:hypothetical protein
MVHLNGKKHCRGKGWRFSFQIDLGKCWEIENLNSVCSEWVGRLTGIRELWFCVHRPGIGHNFGLIWLTAWEWCTFTVTLTVRNDSYYIMIGRVWTLSLNNKTYLVFLWNISSPIKFNHVLLFWWLEFGFLGDSIGVLESTHGWFTTSTARVFSHWFQMLLPM